MWEFIAKTGMNGILVVCLFWAGYNYHLIQENVKIAEAASNTVQVNSVRISVLEANYNNILSRLIDIQTEIRTNAR